jgi:hypothetical protein
MYDSFRFIFLQSFCFYSNFYMFIERLNKLINLLSP